MTDRPESATTPSAEQLLDELAKRDEAEAVGGSNPGSEVDSTVKVLKAELDTLASRIREPPPVVPFEDESECRRVTALVEALGLEPSLPEQTQVDAVLTEQKPLGELGQYQLLAKLGEGGMGTVYKALHTRLDKIVALKVLPVQKTKDSHAVARFEREMRAVGKLEHANIVRAMDANELQQTHYLVMEYVDGFDLSDVLHRVGPLPIADACELVRQAAIGLQHAHEHNLVHRDIKPSNLMVTKQGQLKILDLGLARLHDGHHGELTSTGQVMGTIDFMAPEQTGDSHDVDIRADIYGLGATLFNLLCGRAPYADQHLNTTIKKLNAMATRPVPSVGEHREEVSNELAAIVTQMLAKNADDRYTTPREVANALEPFAGGCDLSALVANCQPKIGDDSADESLASTALYLTDAMTETKSTKVDEPDSQDDHSIATATAPAQSSGGGRITKIVATLAGMAALFAALTVIVIQTNKGNIKVVSNDPDIEVTIRRNGEAIDGFQIKQRDGATSYFSGDYEIELTGGNPDGVSITNETFTLTRGEDVLVTITRDEKLAAKPIPPIAIAPFDIDEAKKHQLAWAQHLGIPAERDIHMPGGEKVTLVLIPPGEFLMGSTKEEQKRLLEETPQDLAANRSIPTEGPARQVQITQPFYLGKYEVTKAQWEAVMGGDPAALQDHQLHPVVDANWDEIPPFLTQLNEHAFAAEKFALPTEEQWEYACRAGTTTLWHFGNSHQTLEEYAWFFDNSGGRTHPVGQLRPNGFGLYDMYGNVWEWCTSTSVADIQATAPEDDRAVTPPDWLHVRRGGSWNCPALNARTAFRHPASPSNRDLGFRLALPISDELIERLKNDSVAAAPQVVASRVRKWPLGPQDNVLPGLVPRPTKLPGIRRWQVETDYPRGGIAGIDYSPDGKWLALGSPDGQVRIYDVATSQMVKMLVGHTSEITTLCWSPDGKRIASADHATETRIWDVENEKTVQTLPLAPYFGQTLSWNPDGDRLAVAVANSVSVWDVNTGDKQLQAKGEGHAQRVAWSPDGKWIAAANGRALQLWNAADGSAGPIFEGHTDAIESIAWRPDGQQIATGANHADGVIRIWNLGAAEPARLLPMPSGGKWVFHSIAWSDDGENLAATSGGTLFVWDMNQETEGQILGEMTYGSRVVWQPGGRQLATAGGSVGNGHVQCLVWDPATGKSRALITSVEATAVAWDPEGTTLAAGDDAGIIRLWNSETGKQQRVLSQASHVWDLAWTLQHLASAGATVQFWNPQQGTSSGSIPAGPGVKFAFDPTGQQLALAGWQQGLAIWKLNSQTKTDLVRGRESGWRIVAWSSDGSRIAAGGSDNTLHVFDLTKNSHVELQGHEERVLSTAWSPDGKWLASGSSDHTVAIWDAATLTADAKPQHRWNVGLYSTTLAWSADSRWLASPGNKNDVRLWDARKQAPATDLVGHGGGVGHLAFHPTGSQLASASMDGTVRIWDPASQAVRRVYLHLPDSQSGSLSPAGEVLSKTGDADDHLVYIVERTDGSRQLLRPSEFHRGIADGFKSVQTDSPIAWQPGPAEDVLPGLVPRPATLPGIKSWQVETVAPRDRIESIAYSPRGDMLACGGADHRVRVYDTATWEVKQLLVGHTVDVYSVAWHPSGKVLASGDRRGVIRLWNADTGEPRGELLGHTKEVFSVAFSPDGEVLASASRDLTTRLWNPDEKTQRETLIAEGPPVWRVAWSPDGRRLASIDRNNVIQIHDIATGQNVAFGKSEKTSRPNNQTPLIAWSPDGQRVAAGGAGSFGIYDAADGSLMLSVGEPVPNEQPSLLVWVREGREIAVRGKQNNRITFFDAASGEELRNEVVQHAHGIHTMAVSPSEDQIAVVGHNEVNVFSLLDWRLLNRIYAGHGEIGSVAFSHDGEQIAVGTTRDLRLLDASDGSLTRLIREHGDGYRALDWHPNDQRLAAGTYQALHIIDSQSKETIVKPSPWDVKAVAWRPDGERLAAQIGNEIHIWDAEFEDPVLILNDHDSYLRDIAWSDDGKRIAAVNYGNVGSAWCWNADTGELLWTHTESDNGGAPWFGSLAFTDGGNRVLLAGNWVTRYADATTGQAEPYLKGTPQIESLALSPDGSRFAAGDYDEGLSIHESTTGRRIGQFSHAHGHYTKVSFSPDGRHVTSGNSGDHTVRLWDTDTGRLVWMNLFLPDGKTAVFSEAGQLANYDPQLEDHLVYIIEKEEGTRELLKPSEFSDFISSGKPFDQWQNSPQLAESPFDDEQARIHQAAWAEYRSVPVERTNSIGMRLRLIPPGQFVMGSSGEGSDANERPEHVVRISQPFLLGVSEVTVGQFREFVEAVGYKTDAETDGLGGATMITGSAQATKKPDINWQNWWKGQTKDHPVVNVSWNDAVAFCHWLSEKEDLIYRLPYDAEYEYARRAGTTTRHPFGDQIEDLSAVANLRDKSFTDMFGPDERAGDWDDGFPLTAPVGSFPANNFGLHDMLGNVNEWCRDWFGPYEPTLQTNPHGPVTGENRVLRGGHFSQSPDRFISSNRGRTTPLNRHCGWGFRVVCELPSEFYRHVGSPSAEPTDPDRRAAE